LGIPGKIKRACTGGLWHSACVGGTYRQTAPTATATLTDRGLSFMTVESRTYRKSINVTSFCKKDINEVVLRDAIKEVLRQFGAVADVEFTKSDALNKDEAENDLWERGFEPTIMDDYS
jgi:hypothetical protein